MKGSCCCGAVRFEIAGQPSMMGTCHCTRCRKAGASVFVFVEKEQLLWISGRDRIARYQPAPPYKYERCFCGTCGTALGELTSENDSFPIAANAFDDDPVVRNGFHEFVAEKPEWYAICDGAKQFAGHPSN